MSICRRIVLGLLALLSPAAATAAEELPRTMLVLDQSDVRGPFYYQIFSGLRSAANSDPRRPVTIYVESLDLSRFTGVPYEESLKRHFAEKYRGKPIGVIVAIGTASRQYVLRWRDLLWPDVPVVFGMVDDAAPTGSPAPADVTGVLMQLPFGQMVTAARAVVSDLQSVVLVGDSWDTQTAYRHWKDEIPAATTGLQVVDLTGMKMAELRTRLAALPAGSAILYSAIYSDGEGTFYPPADAVAIVAAAANRPVIIAAETFLGTGAIGGFVIMPRLIGAEVGAMAMRILAGERADSIPAVQGDVVRPVFDWRQMQRWNVSDARLPPGSEIRFRDPTVWERYRWQIIAIVLIVLLQGALIARLINERRRRRNAELEARQRMAELAHLNRQATAGELSASIAHELNQPLGAILNNAETAELLLAHTSPDLAELKEILAEIKRDDERASEVIKRLRRLLTKSEIEARTMDLNETVREVFDILSVQAAAHNVSLTTALAPETPRISGDRVQLQQTILNLVVNGIEAMDGVQDRKRIIVGRTAAANGTAEVCIMDSGPGILPEKLARVFEPFFTTKRDGMGMGLSIARTIVEAHGGRIMAANLAEGGAVFRLQLPLAKAHEAR